MAFPNAEPVIVSVRVALVNLFILYQALDGEEWGTFADKTELLRETLGKGNEEKFYQLLEIYISTQIRTLSSMGVK
jgi:hypothetical protein